MTERLADINTRIDGVRQLGAVINAMRGIAGARAQQARGQLRAVDAYAATIANAIGRMLPLLPATARDAPASAGRPAVVMFCAEQGFAGAFSERVIAAAAPDLANSKLFIVGTRGLAAAGERGIRPMWQGAMPSHSPGIPRLAETIAEALYALIATGEVSELIAIFTSWQPAEPATIERRRLFPVDIAGFPASPSNPPLLDLPPAALLSELIAAYVQAQLCQAALHAFAAENEARLQAMVLAHNHVDRQIAALQSRQRQIRQEEITAEIIELSTGELAQSAYAAAEAGH